MFCEPGCVGGGEVLGPMQHSRAVSDAGLNDGGERLQDIHVGVHRVGRLSHWAQPLRLIVSLKSFSPLNPYTID